MIMFLKVSPNTSKTMRMVNIKLIIAAAGSGKTTFLVNQALSIDSKPVLITTFTEVNEREIRERILAKKGYIPSNIIVQTWFSFLLKHGVRPYQSLLGDEIHNETIGFYLLGEKSGRKKDRNGKASTPFRVSTQGDEPTTLL